MLALRWSYAKDLFVVALLGAATLVAPHPRHHAVAPPHVVVHHEELIDVELVNVGESAPAPACGDAEQLYEHGAFELAAAASLCADPGDPGHAQLYDQLLRAWDRAAAEDATPETRFEALRYARRLDLSLGGKYVDVLDTKLREAAPLAAAAYARARNQEGVELALTTCDALGVAVPATHPARAATR
jgi:hypothetical protein